MQHHPAFGIMIEVPVVAEDLAQSEGGRLMTDRTSRRGWRRISKEFWVLMGAILLALGWFVWVSGLAMVQHDAVAAIRRSGGHSVL